MGQIAYEAEYAQGKNIADAAALQVGKSLGHFIFSTLSSVAQLSGGKYPGVYHFDSKADVSTYIQDKHPELSAITSDLHVGLYATNWKSGTFMAPKKVCFSPSSFGFLFTK
jgi:hypothetical protein